jgi:hypothetical protein
MLRPRKLGLTWLKKISSEKLIFWSYKVQSQTREVENTISNKPQYQGNYLCFLLAASIMIYWYIQFFHHLTLNFYFHDMKSKCIYVEFSNSSRVQGVPLHRDVLCHDMSTKQKELFRII